MRRALACGSGEGDRPLVLARRVSASVLVVGACPRAAELGIRPGVTLAQARAAMPELLVRDFDEQRDRETLDELAGWAVRFSPLVEPLPPESLLLDIDGCQRLFGGEDNLARQALGGLARQGFSGRAAIADTVGAAYACAAARLEAFTCVPEGQASAYLAGLPPAALRIPRETIEQLHGVGLRSIGDLMMLPRSLLPARFGPLLVLRLQQALGEVHEGIGLRRIRASPHVRTAFDGALQELPALQEVARRLLSQLFRQLVAESLALRQLDCVLYREHAPPTVLQIGFSQPMRVEAHAGRLLEQRLEPVDLSAGVAGVLLVASQTARGSSQQIELFEPRDPQQLEAFGELIDRLVNRLGPDAVMQAELAADHQPERAWRYVEISDGATEPRDAGDEEKENPLASFPPSPGGFVASWPFLPSLPPRPLRLLNPPAAIRAMALAPDGPPVWLEIRGCSYRVLAAEGPERIETGWWRGTDVQRDYFRVHVHTGEQFWLFVDRRTRAWRLHGLFV